MLHTGRWFIAILDPYWNIFVCPVILSLLWVWGSCVVLVIWLNNASVKKWFVCCFQDLWDTVATLVLVNTSIVVWVNTVWSTMRLAKGSASAWTTANHIINLCVGQMGSCTRTIVSSIGPPVSEGSGSPSCTVRSASTKVRAEFN